MTFPSSFDLLNLAMAGKILAFLGVFIVSFLFFKKKAPIASSNKRVRTNPTWITKYSRYGVSILIAVSILAMRFFEASETLNLSLILFFGFFGLLGLHLSFSQTQEA